MIKNKKNIVLILIVIFALSGCTLSLKRKIPVTNQNSSELNGNSQIEPRTLSEKLAAQSKIKKFNNYDELKEYLENNTAGSVSYGYGFGVARNDIMTEKAVAPTVSPGSGFGSLGMAVSDMKAGEFSLQSGCSNTISLMIW